LKNCNNIVTAAVTDYSDHVVIIMTLEVSWGVHYWCSVWQLL